MRFSLLGSGSSGNVAYIESGQTRVLVDAGLSKAEIDKRLQKLPASSAVSIDRIDAVLITHDHSDHAGHARTLGRPLYATAGTRQALSLEAKRVLAGERFTVGALTILPVLLPHDAVETVGYVVSDGQNTVGILTDCGHDAPDVAQGFAGCDLLVLEANHDVTMLRYGPYPPSLKRRVGGRLGHLSNEQSASLLKMILQAGPPPKLVVAAHLSQANNRPQLAKSALDRVLGRTGRVLVASGRGTPIFTLEGGKVRNEPSRNEQLSFTFPSLLRELQ
ncbi:MAG: beta-lactamase domain protein [Myxococcales bacterium]|nr:beta-lactamase domain protein [Myxococcales bacterium]